MTAGAVRSPKLFPVRRPTTLRQPPAHDDEENPRITAGLPPRERGPLPVAEPLAAGSRRVHGGRMSLGFSGDVAGYYAKYRRGYPPEVIDVLCESFALTADDTVLDLGCGTGQLTVPLAARTGRVVGLDPEPDMLGHARRTARRHGVDNVLWFLGADTDVPALGALLGGDGRRRPAAAVIGQALHWMRHEELFAELSGLLRTGGGVAVVANGAPAWQQDSAWSRALRGALEEHFATELKDSCGTARQDRERYARALEAAGFDGVRHTEIRYAETVTFDQLLGGVCSAVPEDLLPPPAERPAFAEHIRRALPRAETFTEDVRVSVLTGRTGSGPPLGGPLPTAP